MYDIALYGHLVLDTINKNNIKTFEFGGIANVLRSLKFIDSTLSVHFSPVYIGTSNIFINTENSERHSKSELNQDYYFPKIKPAKINHICYINELDDTNFIKNLNGLVCADICSGKKLKKDILSHIDYLFISEEDLGLVDIKDIKNTLVIHSPTKSYILNKYEIKGSFISGLNVLGAGDYFAAYFIYSLLGGKTLDVCLKEAHQETTHYLKGKT